jgi:plasmid stability protein
MLADMSKMIQIRHVPEQLHRRLKMRAVATGMSLSDYLLGELRRIAERPTLDEMVERMSKLQPIVVREKIVTAVRKERDRR